MELIKPRQSALAKQVTEEQAEQAEVSEDAEEEQSEQEIR